jgi:hypothetical protein
VTERGMPPTIAHASPVPVQAMHLRNPRLSIPSSMLNAVLR